MIRKATISALLFASFLSSPAQAEEPADAAGAWPRIVTVRATIGDLDLATPAGQAEARQRVARVVSELCRPQALPAGPGRGRVDGHCYRAAMAQARMQIDQAIAARRSTVETALVEHPARGAD